MPDLDGRIAIVTGAAGVIGDAIVRTLRESGANVVGTDVSSAGDVQEHDVTSKADWSRVIEDVRRVHGEVDILCNAAGIRPESANVAEVELNDWNWTMAVNATGVLLGCQAVVPGMSARRAGKIVNIASSTAKEAVPGAVAYSASKHAVIAITQSLAREVAAAGVNVNAICPGPIRSPLLYGSLEPADADALDARLTELMPMRRLVDPEDVGELVVFLASDRSRNINGQSINIDGGRSTHV